MKLLCVISVQFSRSVMSNSFATLWTVACQASLSMRFPRKDYWNGLPFPSLGDPPNPRIELPSPALAGRFFTAKPPGKPFLYTAVHICQSPSLNPFHPP